jgi:L-serine/L-threonine ammonia-lyase
MMNRCEDTYRAPDFVQSIEDEDYNVKLAKLVPMSKATSLGASSPAAGVVKMALDRPGSVHCITIPDEFAMEVALKFLGV